MAFNRKPEVDVASISERPPFALALGLQYDDPFVKPADPAFATAFDANLISARLRTIVTASTVTRRRAAQAGAAAVANKPS